MFWFTRSMSDKSRARLRRSLGILAALALALGISACGKPGLSGEYLASSSTKVERLQLIETSDGHLSGQFEISAIDTNGTIQYVNFAATGVTDGSNVSLTLKPSNMLLGSFNMSGTLSWHNLTLTGGISGKPSSTVTLHSSSMTEYQRDLTTLSAHAAKIIDRIKVANEKAAIAAAQARAQAAAAAAEAKAIQERRNFASGVETLCSEMQKFETEAPSTLSKFPKVANRYRAITSKMEDYLQRDRELADFSNASYTRGQISYAMGKGIYKTNQIHFEIQSLQSRFMSDIGPQMEAVKGATRICKNTSVPVPIVDPACQRLKKLYPGYSKEYREVVVGLASLESAYQSELRKQKELKSKADQLN